jgi:hypothetical protein
MEIHHSSLNYSARSKNLQFADEKSRPENSRFAVNHKNDKISNSDVTEQSKTEEVTANSQQLFKPQLTKPVLTLSVENIVSNRPVNIHNQKAISAYIAESHQPVHEESAQIVSGIDFFV